MKLVRFETPGGAAIGALTGDGARVIDLAKAAQLSGASDAAARFPASMTAFLARGAAGLKDAQTVAASAPAEAAFPLDSVRLLAPVGDPPKIMCIGQNYRDHCLEQNQPFPERVILFSKFTTALNDPGGV